MPINAATRIAMLASALLLVPASGFAQTPPRAGQDEVSNFITVQPPGQWLASQFLGQTITNQAGENIGNINDLLLDKSGQVATAVIGVGGFLGIGEKNVAIPFGSLSVTADANGKRVVTAPLSKARLEAAPEFKPTEKSVYMRAKETAVETARELRDRAGKKIEEMQGEPKSK